MISDFAAHEFKLVTGILGFMQFEKRDRQGKSCPKADSGVGGQGGAEFRDGGIVPVLLQSVVTLAQVGFRSVGRCGLGCSLEIRQGKNEAAASKSRMRRRRV